MQWYTIPLLLVLVLAFVWTIAVKVPGDIRSRGVVAALAPLVLAIIIGAQYMRRKR
jgi:uncharacterized membrane protein (DUF485 family)